MRYRIAIAIPILAASALLSGCGTNADFGRVRPTMYNDDVHAWMGPVTTREYGDPPWRHTLTDEERRLRDLAYPLIDPPYEERGEIDRLGARHALIIQRQVLAPGTQKIQGPIPGDGHQPGQRRALFRGIRLRPVPDFEVAVLQGFLRPVTLPQHTDQHAEQMRRRQLVQPTKGDDIALRRCRE